MAHTVKPLQVTHSNDKGRDEGFKRQHVKRQSNQAAGSQACVIARKSERTRQAILDAALEFLWTHPFRDLTIAELMSRAETSRAAFYQYFADLHDLMDVLLSEMRDDILEAAGPWFKGDGDPASLLRESLSGLVKICYRRGPILRAVVDASASDEMLEKSWAKFLAEVRRCSCCAYRATSGGRSDSAISSAAGRCRPEPPGCVAVD